MSGYDKTGKVYASKGRVRTEMGGPVAILDTNDQVAWVIFGPGNVQQIKLTAPLPKPKPVELPKDLPPQLKAFSETRKVAPLFPRELSKPTLASPQADPCAAHADRTCRKVGSDALNGRETDKWEIRAEGEAQPGHLWVDKRLRRVVRQELGASAFELKNIQEGPQDAKLFTTPEADKSRPPGG